MDSIEKILANLKDGELIFAITTLINALQLYLVCFYFIEDFKNFQWYQEILIPLAISLSYTFIFVVIFHILIYTCSFFSEKCFKILSYTLKSHLVFYYSIAPLSVSFIVQLYKYIHIDNFSFSLEEYFNFSFKLGIGIISSPIYIPLFILITNTIKFFYNQIKKLYYTLF